MHGTSIAAGLGSGAGLAWLWNAVKPEGAPDMPVEVAGIFLAAAVGAVNWIAERVDARRRAAPTV